MVRWNVFLILNIRKQKEFTFGQKKEESFLAYYLGKAENTFAGRLWEEVKYYHNGIGRQQTGT